MDLVVEFDTRRLLLFQVFINLALFLHLVLTSLVLHHSIPVPQDCNSKGNI